LDGVSYKKQGEDMTTTATTTALDRSPFVVDKWFKRIFHALITRIRHGRIVLYDGDEKQIFGPDSSQLVEVRVHHSAFYRKILAGGSIGAGEAYVKGYWSTDDLPKLIRIVAMNLQRINRIEKRFSWIFQPIGLLRHKFRVNTKKGSKKNIIAHYDLGNELYKSFLDPTMMYSAAIFPNEDSTLEEASLNKLETICRKLDLQPTDHVVEIGSGWGGFAIYAAVNYGCKVTTITISDAQFEEAQKRIQKAGVDGKVTLLKKDYRDLTGKYDKLVSIEMIEAVGHKYLPVFFEKCGELLNSNGKMLIQAITIRDQAYKQYVNSVDFIQKHIFPGGCIPSNTRMLELLTRKTDLVVRNLDDFGHHYARTLKEWRKRFNQSFPQLKRYGFDETFHRLWNYYMSYCEGGFHAGTISVVQLVATKPENVH